MPHCNQYQYARCRLTEQNGSLLVPAGHIHDVLAVIATTEIYSCRFAAVGCVTERQLPVRVLSVTQ